jgi:hypothetical protein
VIKRYFRLRQATGATAVITTVQVHCGIFLGSVKLEYASSKRINTLHLVFLNEFKIEDVNKEKLEILRVVSMYSFYLDEQHVTLTRFGGFRATSASVKCLHFTFSFLTSMNNSLLIQL